MRTIFRVIAAAAIGSVALGHTGPLLAGEVTLKAVTFLPKQVIYTKSFMKFVDKVNERGEGMVKIRVLGGPEVTPQRELGQALKNGLVDMVNIAPGLFLNIMPEGDAIAGSNVSAPEQRANGGVDLFNEIFAKKMNAKMLAHVDAYGGFHVYLTKKPNFTDNGGVDFSGLKIRTAPLYREFITSLGATNVVQSAGQVYTSLERGIVDGTGWPLVGFRDWGWHKFIKYRVDPPFFQTDVIIAVNLNSWNKLSPEAQKLVQDIALEHEAETYEEFRKASESEDAEIRKAGIEVITLEGEARETYLADAYRVPWERMKSRGATRIDELRAKFLK